MQPLTRKTLAEEAALTIAGAIRSGTLEGALPGYRMLCQKLNISRSALTPAIEKLLAEGWLIASGPRKRYVTNVAEEGESATGTRARKLWILEPVERKQLSAISPYISEPLFARLGKLGWTSELSVVVVNQTRRHDKMWDQLLNLQQPDALLLVSPHRTTAEWAAGCGIPVCVMGGDAHGLPLSMVGFESVYMVECSLENMLARGHRDLCLPVSVRTPGFVSRIHEVMEVVLARHGIAFVPAWHAPLSLSNTPQGIYELLTRRFALSCPSALMIFGDQALKTVMGFLLQRGLSVPRDVSLVLLDDWRKAEWIQPPVSCFSFPSSRMVSFISRWLSAGRDRERKHQVAILKPKWIEGTSLSHASSIEPQKRKKT